MKFSCILIACIIILVAHNYSLAKDNYIDSFEEKCCAKNYTTQGMLECTQKAYKMWDIELNKYYSLLMKELSPQEKQGLKSAQIAWLNFRDKEFININNIYNKLQGTMYINVKTGEKREVVKQRAEQLRIYYETLNEK